MSAAKSRVGGPITPTVTTSGTPGASDQVVEFQDAAGRPSPVRPCVVTNIHATDALFVLVNEEGATATNYLERVAAGSSVDVSYQGRLSVNKLSFFYAAAAYSNALARGWPAGTV